MKRLLSFLLLATSLVAAQGPAFPYSVVLTWTAPETSGVTGYNMYRAPYTSGTCGPYAVINTAPITAATYTDATVASGAQYCYEVTALVGAAESGPAVNSNNPVSLPP